MKLYMQDKYKVIALISPSGGGKDYVRKQLQQSTNWHYVIHHTTRPRRENEVHGVDYWFEPIIEKNKGNYITSFRNWDYSLQLEDFVADNYNLIISNPKELRMLLNDERLEVKVFWLYCEQDERIKRQYLRGDDVNEITRRLETDLKDFNEIDVDDRFRYIDNNLNAPVSAADIIKKWVEVS